GRVSVPCTSSLRGLGDAVALFSAEEQLVAVPCDEGTQGGLGGVPGNKADGPVGESGPEPVPEERGQFRQRPIGRVGQAFRLGPRTRLPGLEPSRLWKVRSRKSGSRRPPRPSNAAPGPWNTRHTVWCGGTFDTLPSGGA